jgi:O-antigen ligase
MSGDQPIAGVGLDNFSLRSLEYTREPGGLDDLIPIEEGQPVHNGYLSYLAETGIIGLTLYLALAVAVLRAGARAASYFEIAEDHAAATMTRATIVALFGILSAVFFLPNAGDKRIFALMALALASFAVAKRAHRQDSAGS